ncbi:MAG: lytic transglycosylase domain-containing protein [Marmoricola sp.]
MPEKYAPKHRGEPPRHRGERPQRFAPNARKLVLIPSLAVAVTGLTVGVGMAVQGTDRPDPVHLASGTSGLSAADLASRTRAVSRSNEDRTTQADALKVAELSPASGHAVTRTENLAQADPKTLTRALMPIYGLASSDFECIDEIWTQESGWNVHADNPSSSAYGIPQALPGSKMASSGADWRNSAETQIRWGLQYIEKRYGTACAAWSFKRSHGYY